jgi:hypothetical protein
MSARHVKGAGLQYRNREVMGRLFWDTSHPSPWMLFRNITEYRRWATEIRKARPGTKTEYLVNIHWTPESMLRSVQETARTEMRREKARA